MFDTWLLRVKGTGISQIRVVNMYSAVQFTIHRLYVAHRLIKFFIRLLTHTFNGPFSSTTQVSRYQKGKTNLDFTEARDNEWQWHQVGHMQVCRDR